MRRALLWLDLTLEPTDPAILPSEVKHEPADANEEDRRDPKDRVVQKVDIFGKDRGLLWKPKIALRVLHRLRGHRDIVEGKQAV